jgi:hypothetical protein
MTDHAASGGAAASLAVYEQMMRARTSQVQLWLGQ